MKQYATRLSAVVMLAMLLVIGLLPGKMEVEEDTGITVSDTYEEDVYIHIRSADAHRQADGWFLVEVIFTTDTARNLTDMLEVTVFCGAQKKDFFLTADNMNDIHTVCFTEILQSEEVRVEIRDHQTEEGLLLMCDGEGQLCGKAAAPVNGDRVLKLSCAAAGALYKIYRVAALSDLLSGMVVLNVVPTEDELKTYAVRENYTVTLTADASGFASCNFTLEGLEDGVYLIAGEGEAFYVCLPSVEASGAFKSSTVSISLRNEERNWHNAQN